MSSETLPPEKSAVDTPAAPAAPPQPNGVESREGGAASASDLRSTLLAALLRDHVDHLADAIEHGTVSLEGDEVLVRSSEDYRTSLELDMASLEEALAKVLNRKVRVRLGDDLDSSELREVASGASRAPAAGASASARSADGETQERALADPAVQMIQKTFEGQVREVRNLRGYSS